MEASSASRNPSTSTTPDEQRRKKRIHLVRHGVTHMNVYLTKNPYGGRGFEDPLDFDTRLTPRGVEQARSLSSRTAELLKLTPSKSSSSPSSFAVVVSPLTRALQTASLAFPSLVDESRRSSSRGGEATAATANATTTTTMVSLALARERVWLSSEVGRPRSSLSSEFPHVCFADLPPYDSPWWHGGAEAAAGRVRLEPAGAFRRRVAALREALLSRPEDEIALVSHAGVLEALTGGRFFHNCELVTLMGEELLRVDIVGGDGVEEEEEDGVEGDGFLF